MGKGDKKTKRGKIWGGSCGVRRPKSKKSAHPNKKNVNPVVKVKEQFIVKEEMTPKKTEVAAEVINNIPEEVVSKKTTKPKLNTAKKETTKNAMTKKSSADKETKNSKESNIVKKESKTSNAKKTTISKTKKEEKSE